MQTDRKNEIKYLRQIQALSFTLLCCFVDFSSFLKQLFEHHLGTAAGLKVPVQRIKPLWYPSLVRGSLPGYIRAMVGYTMGSSPVHHRASYSPQWAI